MLNSPRGEPVGRLRADLAAKEVTPADVRAFKQRFPDGSGPEDLAPQMRAIAEDVLRELRYPKTRPVLDAPLFDTTNRLWVRTPPGLDDTTAEWNVFDDELHHVAELPTSDSVRAIVDDYVYATVRDDLEVDRVKAYRLIPASR